MNLAFSSPSKTFLCGEYAVLLGAPALLIATQPRFELKAVPGTGKIKGIPEKSPAARWLYHRAPIIEKWDIEFLDPHGGQGGFGASGAQFLFVHALTTFLQSSVSQAAAGAGLNLKDILHDHKVLTDGQGSGADILSQALGGVALVDVNSSRGEARAWPFEDLSFAIVRTGVKIATHEHLRQLNRDDLHPLLPLNSACVESFVSGSSREFVKRIKDFSTGLRNIKVQAASTLDLLDGIEKQTWCLAAKGCGALGADTVLVIFESGASATVQNYFSARGLPAVLGPAEISGGMDMKWSWDEN